MDFIKKRKIVVGLLSDPLFNVSDVSNKLSRAGLSKSSMFNKMRKVNGVDFKESELDDIILFFKDKLNKELMFLEKNT